MKKVMSLLVAVFFMTGMVVAQSNNSTVDQDGTGHGATVNQNGETNQSDITQDQGFSYNLNKGSNADVDQDGKLNSSSINSWGWNHEVYVTQDGKENSSAIKQSGGENDAYLDQIGDMNVLRGVNAGSAAFQKAGDPFGGDKNYFDVDQMGDENVVGMWQEHSADAIVYQGGNKNVTEIFQTGAPFGARNNADVEINGNENMTKVHQDGDGNSAYMDVGHPNYVSEMNDVSMKQVGNGNQAIFGLQHGDENVVEIDQDGNNNYTNYSIEYGNKNEATYDVDGDANRSRFYVDADWTDWSNGNTLELTQDGYRNYASGIIKGDENTVTMIQEGDKNLIGNDWWTSDGVNIHGNLNTVNIEQFGNGHKSLNTVTGNGNTIDVIQQP